MEQRTELNCWYLAAAFHDGLKDVLFAERTSVRALKRAPKQAQK